MPQITIKNVNKYYFDKKNKIAVAALYNINCIIPNNSFTVVIGESGSGKTTLIKAISGLTQVDDGKIYFNDSDVTNKPAGERNLSYISQEFALYPHLTVFDNIAYPLKIAKSSPDEIRLRVKEMLELLDITILSSRKPKQLSIGERQRVSLSRALIKRPSLLLLDEPFSNIDEIHRQEFIKELKALKEKFNLTIVYVTHKLDEAKFLATDMIIINNGEVVESGKASDVLNNPNGYYCKNIAIYNNK